MTDKADGKKARHANGQKSFVSAAIGVMTSSGEYISSRALRKGGMQIVEKGAAYRLEMTSKAAAAAEFDASKELAVSREITDDQDPFDYDQDGSVKPPFPFNVLGVLASSNTYHAACIETKASDYAFNRFRLETNTWAKQHIDQTTLETAREEVEMFLAHLGDGRAIEDICRDVAIDYESLGSGGFEIRRDANGFIRALNHIPFSTMRVLKHAVTEKTGASYIQKRFNRKVYYMAFNKNVAYKEAGFNPLTARISEYPSFSDRHNFISMSGLYTHAYSSDETTNLADAANEFYMMARPPFTLSNYYGTPAGSSAYGSMLAQLKIDQFNLQFFSGKGVPQYAIIFEGMSPPGGEIFDDDDASLGDEATRSEQDIQEFFAKRLMSSDRSVLILNSYGNAKIKLQALSTQTLEASFGDYEKRCRDMVFLAHRIPKTALGISDAANLGAGRDTAQLRRYRDHIVAPGHRQFENMINAVIKCGTLIPYFTFKFEPMNLEEENEKKDFALKEFTQGAITLDEYLEQMGRPPVPENKGKLRIIRTNAVTILTDEDGLLENQLNTEIAKEVQFRSLIERGFADALDVTPSDSVIDNTMGGDNNSE